MEIRVVNREQINDFAGQQSQAQFLQSWEWGEFQERVGFKVRRIGFFENNEPIWLVTLIKKPLLFGKYYFYAPRIGIKGLSDDQIAGIFKELRKIAHQENSVFLRFDPLSDPRSAPALSEVEGIRDSRVVKTIDVQPSITSIINIDRGEEEILNSMHHKTRYNIRLANKKGVEVAEGKKEDFETFWNIMEATKDRDKFRLHSKNYYSKMLDIGFIKLYLARFDGKIIAGTIISFFGNMATYIHGASSNEYRNVMAPHALQWQAIKDAKRQGLKYYDLNGIDEAKWPGVTRFKKGFGGVTIAYPGTYDFIINSTWYKIYKILRNIRRKF